jgi:hypothetical protein
MSSRLEESTKTAKKIAIGCLALVVFVLLFNFASRLFKKPAPPYNPYPTIVDKKFGVLPPLIFESLKLAEISKAEFKLDTTDAKLPTFYSIINVYKTKIPKQSLTAQDDAVASAEALGFTGSPQVISSTELKWTSGTRTFKINKLYKTATITTDFANDQRAKQKHNVYPNEETYIQSAKNFLKSAGLFPSDYAANGTNSLAYLKLDQNNRFVSAGSSSEASFVRVDFYRRMNEFTLTYPAKATEEQKKLIYSKQKFCDQVTSNPKIGLIYLIIGGENGVGDIYEMSYTNWEIQDTATYSLTPVKDAWEQVQQNKGTLRYLNIPNGNPTDEYIPLKVQTFFLNNVEIIYYSSPEYIQYIQPLYKFSGLAQIEGSSRPDKEFIIYYPAIKNE